jgi:hypothetical protein
MEATTHISDERVQDMLCCAIEGGSNYWYMIKRYEFAPGITKADFEFAHLEVPFKEGCSIIFTTDDQDGEYVLNRESLAAGLQRMCDEYPNHYANFMIENDDAETCDVFLQCCLFGEIVYG